VISTFQSDNSTFAVAGVGYGHRRLVYAVNAAIAPAPKNSENGALVYPLYVRRFWPTARPSAF
jgi:hypothetical protein